MWSLLAGSMRRVPSKETYKETSIWKLAEKECELEELKRYVADESRKFSEALTLLEHQINILSIDNGPCQMDHINGA